jgi:hypothetical protein
VKLSPDGLHASLTLEDLKPGFVYQMDLVGFTGRDGTPLVNSTVYYTLNQLRQPGAAPAIPASR